MEQSTLQNRFSKKNDWTTFLVVGGFSLHIALTFIPFRLTILPINIPYKHFLQLRDTP